VKDRHRVVISLQQMGHLIGAVLGSAEDDDGIVIHAVEQGQQ